MNNPELKTSPVPPHQKRNQISGLHPSISDKANFPCRRAVTYPCPVLPRGNTLTLVSASQYCVALSKLLNFSETWLPHLKTCKVSWKN